MNIGEANAINIVLRVVVEEYEGTTPSSGSEIQRIRDAAIFLAGQANKVLGAGIRPAEIEERWPA